MLPRSTIACCVLLSRPSRRSLSPVWLTFEALRLPALPGADQGLCHYERRGITDGISHSRICSAPLLEVRDEMPVAACPPSARRARLQMRKRTHANMFLHAPSHPNCPVRGFLSGFSALHGSAVTQARKSLPVSDFACYQRLCAVEV
jgi:hypothetical protein